MNYNFKELIQKDEMYERSQLNHDEDQETQEFMKMYENKIAPQISSDKKQF